MPYKFEYDEASKFSMGEHDGRRKVSQDMRFKERRKDGRYYNKETHTKAIAAHRKKKFKLYKEKLMNTEDELEKEIIRLGYLKALNDILEFINYNEELLNPKIIKFITQKMNEEI